MEERTLHSSFDDMDEFSRASNFASLMAGSGSGFTSRVSGASMGMSMPHGSSIVIQPVEKDRYVLGEVVACLSGTNLVAHRIIYKGHGKLANHLVTRGDAWLLCDPPIQLSEVVGKIASCDFNGAVIEVTVKNVEHVGFRKLAAAMSLIGTIAVMHLSIPGSKRLCRRARRASYLPGRIAGLIERLVKQ